MQPIIPGAYERNTLTRRQSGSMGGSGLGAAAATFSYMDAAGLADRQREGGRVRRRLPWWRRFLALFSPSA